MSPVSPETLPRCKKPKVFAVRHFPHGCGPNEVKSFDKSAGEAQQEFVKGGSEFSEFQNGNYYSKIYGLAKRRKIFPVRQFPPGCGPDAAIVEEQMKSNDGFDLILETNEGICSEMGIRSGNSSSKCEILEGQTAEDDLKRMENVSSVKREIVMKKSARVGDTENELNLEKSMAKQVTMGDGSVKIKFSEKTLVENRDDSFKEKHIGKSILIRSNTDKMKSSFKLGSSEIFGRSLSDKTLGGYKNIKIEDDIGNPSHAAEKSKVVSKLSEKYGKPFVGKHLAKEIEITQRVGDSLKQKLSPETLYKDQITDEGEESLEAYGEKMILQTLLAAENSKRSCLVGSGSGFGSDFVKTKKMKEKGLAERKTASMFSSFSQQRKKGLIDDTVHMGGENRSCKELTVFKKPNAVSVAMTALTPYKLSQKTADQEEVLARHRVKRALRMFQLICRKLLQGEESSSKRLGKANRIDLKASKVLKENGEWASNGLPIMGCVGGVEVGDEFHYRVELSIIGLHRLFQGGIDSMKQYGKLLAVSIVASGGYEDDVDASDVLIYSGSGGISSGGDKQPGDQKLERGNLALKNCIEAQTPVRVILGYKEKGDLHDSKCKLVSTFTYAGLYHVESYWKEKGSHGFNVFKFQLKRKPGQPELAFKELKRVTMSRTREGLCVKDVTQGKEKIPIPVVNTIDTDLPTPFKYVGKNIYPSSYCRTRPRGCDCIDGCSDSEKCYCAVKNGGEIPYNFSGAIVQVKPLIYECGPSCKCPPSCYNRVVQHGIRLPLEVFKTSGRGWGVRSLKSISSGSFVCGYIGELLQEGEAEQRKNDEYLFEIGQNYDDRSLWGDLPNLIPELQSTSCDIVENVGFAIDAVEYGNVGRFINHSCSPNLYAQNVLYDHDDKSVPHIMFFAVDNIPPLQELTYHYNYHVDKVFDSEGNLKKKACYCGSPDCRGRLY